MLKESKLGFPWISHRARLPLCLHPAELLYIVVVSPELRSASACHLEFCATAQAEPSGTAASHWWCLLWCHPGSCSHKGICCLSVWSRCGTLWVSMDAPNCQLSDLSKVSHLHFFLQSELATAEDHLIGDRKVSRQRCAAPDHRGVHSVQELVAEERVLLPVVLNILWTEGGTLNHQAHRKHRFNITVHQEITWCSSFFAAKHPIDAADIGPVLLTVVQTLQLQLSQSRFKTEQ